MTNYQIYTIYHVAVLLILFHVHGFASVNRDSCPKKLSQQQMYEDYDYLCNIILSSYPYLELSKEIMNHSIDSALIKNRNAIPTITDIENFSLLINKVVNLLHDGHTSIVAPGTLKYYLMKYPRYCEQIGINEEIQEMVPAYYAMTHDSIYKKVKLGLRFKYLNGMYYNLRPFVFGHDTIATGSVLESVNGMPTVEYVASNHEVTPDCRWDEINKTYYSDYFYLSPAFVNSKRIQFQFSGNHKNKIPVDVKPVDTLPILIKENQENTPFKVEYLSKLNALYIRMGKMEKNEVGRLIKETLPEETSCIILDVRGNRGGNDQIWKELISLLTGDTITFRKQIYAKESSFNEQYLRSQIQNIAVDTLPLFPGKRFFRIYDDCDRIVPAPESIKFKGKIFILGDENTFSSGQSLMAMAKSDENIISIGVSTGRICGFGITPPILVLPNSKIVVSMPCTLDYSNVRELKDLLHDRPEYEIEQSVAAYTARLFKNNQSGEDFYNEGDPYFGLIEKVLDEK